jgi:hypothetical protein
MAVSKNFVVLECIIESVFADTSIAYDVVNLRQIDAYIETPDGQKVLPMQTLIGPLEEEQREALRLFRRTNLLVFPRQDVWLHRPLIRQGQSRMRLVLKGYDSRFYFEWLEAPSDEPRRFVPTEEEARRLAKTGYTELFSALRRLAHMFD